MSRTAIRDLPFKHNTRPGLGVEAVASSKLKKQYGDLQLDVILELGADAQFAKR